MNKQGQNNKKMKQKKQLHNTREYRRKLRLLSARIIISSGNRSNKRAGGEGAQKKMYKKGNE